MSELELCTWNLRGLDCEVGRRGGDEKVKKSGCDWSVRVRSFGVGGSGEVGS